MVLSFGDRIRSSHRSIVHFLIAFLWVHSNTIGMISPYQQSLDLLSEVSKLSLTKYWLFLRLDWRSSLTLKYKKHCQFICKIPHCFFKEHWSLIIEEKVEGHSQRRFWRIRFLVKNEFLSPFNGSLVYLQFRYSDYTGWQWNYLHGLHRIVSWYLL